MEILKFRMGLFLHQAAIFSGSPQQLGLDGLPAVGASLVRVHPEQDPEGARQALRLLLKQVGFCATLEPGFPQQVALLPVRVERPGEVVRLHQAGQQGEELGRGEPAVHAALVLVAPRVQVGRAVVRGGMVEGCGGGRRRGSSITARILGMAHLFEQAERLIFCIGESFGVKYLEELLFLTCWVFHF